MSSISWWELMQLLLDRSWVYFRSATDFFAYESCLTEICPLMKLIKLSHQSGKVRWQGYTYLSAVTMLLCILSSGCYMIYYNIIMINYTITAVFVTAVIHFGMARLGIASGEFDALIRRKFYFKNRQIIAPRGPAPDDISRKQLPSKQTTASYGKSLLWVLWQKSAVEATTKMNGSLVSLVMLPQWFPLSARRGGCCVCLARHASFTRASHGKSLGAFFPPVASEYLHNHHATPNNPAQTDKSMQERAGEVGGSRAAEQRST